MDRITRPGGGSTAFCRARPPSLQKRAVNRLAVRDLQGRILRFSSGMNSQQSRGDSRNQGLFRGISWRDWGKSGCLFCRACAD